MSGKRSRSKGRSGESTALCSRCGEKKPVSAFTLRKDGRQRPWCRACFAAYNANWRAEHPSYHVNYNVGWRARNYDHHREYMREYRREWMRQFRAKNPERARESAREYGRRRLKSPQYRVARAVSQNISHAIQSRKGGRHWEHLVGYSLAELVLHLESQFSDGMSWDRYSHSGWTIDHIIPASLFDQCDDAQFAACWSLPNLRPMWSHDNFSKSDFIFCIGGKRVRDLTEVERRELLATVLSILGVAQ